MDLQQYLADISLKTMSQLHRAIVHLTGGQVLGSAFGMPVVELHTVGRKSGQPRSTMLTVPVIEGDRVVLVASKGGDDRDPDWYRNLIAQPDIELTMAAGAGRCGPARRHRKRRRSCGPRWWPPTGVTAVTSAAPNATSRWSSASRAERPPRLAPATAVRRGGSASTVSGGPAHRRISREAERSYRSEPVPADPPTAAEPLVVISERMITPSDPNAGEGRAHFRRSERRVCLSLGRL